MPNTVSESEYLKHNLRALMERLGESVRSLDQQGRETWFKKVESTHFTSNDAFPSTGTIQNWLNGKGYMPAALFVLCAYLHFGRYGEALPTNYIDICQKMAYRMANTPTKEQFLWDYPLPRSTSKPGCIVSKPSEGKAPTKDEISKLMQTAILAIQKAQEEIRRELQKLNTTPVSVQGDFERMTVGAGAHTTRLDDHIEKTCVDVFTDKHGSAIHAEGEESLKRYKTPFPGWAQRYCALLDVVDGTDLVAMDINLWCSAIALYDRDRSRILGAVVGLPSGKICVARDDEVGAWFARDAETGAIPGDNQPLAGHSGITELLQARIAFYGQKPGSFLEVATDQRFLTMLARIEEQPETRLRIYNFAGNPIIVKLVDREKGGRNQHITDGVDAVFEKRGQRPHDFVPAMFIAMKKDAFICGLDEALITYETLGEMVRWPDNATHKYVIAASSNLAINLVSNLSDGHARTAQIEPVSGQANPSR